MPFRAFSCLLVCCYSWSCISRRACSCLFVPFGLLLLLVLHFQTCLFVPFGLLLLYSWSCIFQTCLFVPFGLLLLLVLHFQTCLFVPFRSFWSAATPDPAFPNVPFRAFCPDLLIWYLYSCIRASSTIYHVTACTQCSQSHQPENMCAWFFCFQAGVPVFKLAPASPKHMATLSVYFYGAAIYSSTYIQSPRGHFGKPTNYTGSCTHGPCLRPI